VNEKAVSLEEIANSDTVGNQADDCRDSVWPLDKRDERPTTNYKWRWRFVNGKG
jgi:hypothetical protein